MMVYGAEVILTGEDYILDVNVRLCVFSVYVRAYVCMCDERMYVYKLVHAYVFKCVYCVCTHMYILCVSLYSTWKNFGGVNLGK